MSVEMKVPGYGRDNPAINIDTMEQDADGADLLPDQAPESNMLYCFTTLTTANIFYDVDIVAFLKLLTMAL